MKLTTERIKKLIREEINNLNEKVSRNFVRRDKVKYEDGEYTYYVFIKDQSGLKKLSDIKVSGPQSKDNPIGHYRVKNKVNDPDSLWNAIKDQEESKHGKFKTQHMFVVGSDDKVKVDKIKSEIV
jgi:lipopolysaccharide export LptBFGC system permease protein LptF|tara:strand:+ start:865 stop:1239 length:375 start_codon:yes stop_codon:yes gene_type:complete